MPTNNDDESEIRRNLAAIYRLLFHYKMDESIFGHATALVPGTDCFLINHYGLRFDEVTASNLLKVPLADIPAKPLVNPAGVVLHRAVYRARTDVRCVIHIHTPAIVAVSADRDGLLPISQSAIVENMSMSYHDYQGIVVDQSEEDLLQKNLGTNRNMLLRNHGLLVAGDSFASAWLSVYNVNQACEIQVRTNKNNLIIPPGDVLEKSKRRLGEFVSDVDGRVLNWLAMIRLVERLYPDYKE